MSNRRGTVFLLGTAVAAWLIYDMASTTGVPSQTLAILQYVVLAILVTATVSSGVMCTWSET